MRSEEQTLSSARGKTTARKMLCAQLPFRQVHCICPSDIHSPPHPPRNFLKLSISFLLMEKHPPTLFRHTSDTLTSSTKEVSLPSLLSDLSITLHHTRPALVSSALTMLSHKFLQSVAYIVNSYTTAGGTKLEARRIVSGIYWVKCNN